MGYDRWQASRLLGLNRPSTVELDAGNRLTVAWRLRWAQAAAVAPTYSPTLAGCIHCCRAQTNWQSARHPAAALSSEQASLLRRARIVHLALAVLDRQPIQRLSGVRVSREEQVNDRGGRKGTRPRTSALLTFIGTTS